MVFGGIFSMTNKVRFFLLGIFLISIYVYAQQAAPVVVQSAADILKDIDPDKVAVIKEAAPPAWLTWVIGWTVKIPYIGPFTVFIMKWSGFLAAVTTALAIALETVFSLIAKTFNKVGWANLAVTVDKAAKMSLPWVKYFSMLNAKKETASAVAVPVDSQKA